MHPRILVLTITVLLATFTMQSYAQWEQCNGPWTGLGVNQFQSYGYRVYAFTRYGIYRTTTSGSDWKKLDCCFTSVRPESMVAVPDEHGDTLLITGGYEEVYISSDFGDSWISQESTPSRLMFELVGAGRTNAGEQSLYALNSEQLYRSTDYGVSWKRMWNGMQTQVGMSTITSVVQLDSLLFVGSRYGVFSTTDFGQTWIEPETSGDVPDWVRRMTYQDGVLYAACVMNPIDYNDPCGLYTTTDSGRTWEHRSTDAIIWTLSWSPDSLKLYAENRVSTDLGYTWRTLEEVVRPIAVFEANGGTGIIGQKPYEGVYLSTDEGNTWQNVNKQFATWPVYGFDIANPESANHTLYAGFESVGIFKSSDNGDSWHDITNVIEGRDFRSVTTFSDQSGHISIFAGTTTGLYVSENDGLNWSSQVPGLYTGDIFDIDLLYDGSDTIHFAATGRGAYKLTSGDPRWRLMSNGLSTESTYREVLHCKDVSGTFHLFLGTPGSGVYHSTDLGTTWSQVNAGLDDLIVYSLAIVEDGNGVPVLLAGTGKSHIYRSTDYGTSWSLSSDGLTTFEQGAYFQEVSSLCVYGNHVFAGTAGSSYSMFGTGVFVSTDFGQTWTPVNKGFERGNVHNMHVGGNYLYASTASDAVWRRPLSEMVTVSVNDPEQPSSIALHANYPNPFTGTTSISYTVPTAQPVTLTVYNTLGQPVRVIQRDAQPGTNTVQLTSLNPGLFMVVLRGKDGVVTRMLVAK